MADRLTFGTAGLRAPLGEGPLAMNVEIVEQVATAIGRWLPAKSEVVIGRDARNGSEDFANVTARVLAEMGHVPRLFVAPVPTPVVAHEVATTAAAGGVMVTASHNPATDNGYKVYSADGGQLLPADSVEIEALMAELPWPADVSVELPSAVERLGAEQVDAYLATVTESIGTRRVRVEDGQARNGLTIVYTALHGVGAELFMRALESAGHRVISVPEQHDPDPAFPTAAFPNPEEPGTLDLAIALAEAEDADLILANDPDADRLAVAVRRAAGWERLTGDEIGVLLADRVLQTADRGSEIAVATTVVSSSLLAKLAAAGGVPCHTTLTGFKWLARATSGTDETLLFAYEEALGYAVVPTIRDKDGISAGLMFAEMVSGFAEGVTVDSALAGIHATHGVHVNGQYSKRFDGEDSMTQMSAVMESLRSNPPEALASNGFEDLIAGSEVHAPTDMLIYHVDGGRVILRPSGTEPKLKAYLEAVDRDSAVATQRLTELETVVRELLA